MSALPNQEQAIHDLLSRTSRTFGLAIPLLPFPTQRQVSVAYLLFRIADTIEDGEALSRAEKLAAFDHYHEILAFANRGAEVTPELNLPRPPTENRDYLELIEELPVVIAALQHFPSDAKQTILRSVSRSALGMRRFVESADQDGTVNLTSVSELHEYCYAVAGLVGEMLTELFVQGASWLDGAKSQLLEKAPFFGEGLQLVNILKDADQDQSLGRQFIPPNVSRVQLFELARRNLAIAEEYTMILREADAPSGFTAFTQLPVDLAYQALDCVSAHGPGAKIPRSEVVKTLHAVQHREPGNRDVASE